MKSTRRFVFLALSFLSACGQFNVSIEPISTTVPTLTAEVPTATATVTLLPTVQITPTATLLIPSPTYAQPIATQIQTLPPAATTAAPTAAAHQTVKIVLIELEGNGQSGPLVGCGDSAIPINVTIPRTHGVLRAALEKLLSAKQQFYGEAEYYNALYQSNLQVENVSIEQGMAIIHLTGSLVLGGACDSPRVEAQLEQTALQFSTVNDVAVFVNDVPLEEALSTK